MKESEMEAIAQFIHEALNRKASLKELKSRVTRFRMNYQEVKYTFKVKA